MIIVFQDDGTVVPFGTVAQVNEAYESIDVENGAYTFVDERGMILKPMLRAPSESKLFGFISVYRLVPFTLQSTAEKNEALLARLRHGEFLIGKGPTSISTLDELRCAAPELFCNEI